MAARALHPSPTALHHPVNQEDIILLVGNRKLKHVLNYFIIVKKIVSSNSNTISILFLSIMMRKIILLLLLSLKVICLQQAFVISLK